jgi:hypothetical protein
MMPALRIPSVIGVATRPGDISRCSFDSCSDMGSQSSKLQGQGVVDRLHPEPPVIRDKEDMLAAAQLIPVRHSLHSFPNGPRRVNQLDALASARQLAVVHHKVGLASHVASHRTSWAILCQPRSCAVAPLAWTQPARVSMRRAVVLTRSRLNALEDRGPRLLLILLV